MKRNEIKLNMKVIDSWYPEWGNGIIVEIKKTVVKIKFRYDLIRTYDFPHLKFLREVKL